MRLTSPIFVALCMVGSAPAWAQDEFEDTKAAPKKDEAPAEGEATPAEGAAPATTPSGTVEQRFNIRRGFFTEGDFGLYLAFGGRNTNNPNLPTRSTSNIQPYLGITIGYDVVSNESLNFSIGPKFALLLNGGAGRPSAADIADAENVATTHSNDFSIFEAGLAATVSIMMTDRLALAIRVDGGLGATDPNPALWAEESADAGAFGFGAMFGAGVGVEYFTLLNGFTVGANLRFVGVLAEGMIPGAAFTIPVKYNF